MARTGWSASNFLRNGSPPLTAVPLTLACWYWPAATGTTKYIFGLYNSSGGDSRNMFAIQQNSAGTLSAKTADGTTSNSATTAGSVTTSAWQHVCAVFASATSRAIYLAGGSKATNATSRTPTGINRMSVGLQDNAAGSKLPIDSTARVAHCAIWNVALSDADVASLGAGVHPLLIRPDALIFYSPVGGQYSPEIGYVGGLDLTVNGTLSAADDPAVFWPAVARRGAFHSVPKTNVSIPGVAGTGLPGTFGIAVQATLTGVAGASAVGTLAFQVLKTLTGVAATGAVGLITPKVLIGLLGVQGVAALGALVADTAQRINLVGVQGTSAVGNMAAAVEFLLTGNLATADVGLLSWEIALALEGVAAEMDVGDFTISDNWTRVAGSVGTVWTNKDGAPTVWTPVSGNPATWTRQ